MQNTIALLDIDLRLFDGAAAAAGGDAGADGQAIESALSKAETNSRSGSSRRSKSGAFENVVFGKQEDAPAQETTDSPAAGGDAEGSGKADVSTTSDTLEAKRKAFEDMISGEYKELYEEKFNKAFTRRFKESKAMENSLNAQKPIMDMLMQRYQIGDGDVAKLQAAIEQDTNYWQDAADKAGLTVEQYQSMQKLERENAELKRLRRHQIATQQGQERLNAIYQEADKVKELYPAFNLQAECQNRDFMGLLRNGISVQQAYELMHMEEIKQNAARAAAQSAGEQMVAKLKSKASRPLENGTSSQSAAIVKNDVHSLTREERAEIVRRAQRGAQIKF